MAASRYNFWSRTPGGQALLYNARSGALLELADDEIPLVEAALRGEANETAPALRAGGCIVADDSAERAAALRQFGRAVEESPVVELTISPTYGCNFRCTYCYVDFDETRMPGGAADAVHAYVARQVAAHRPINITWFGGEPLLQWRRVVAMAAGFTRLAEGGDARIRQFLTTNGYLLTSEVADAVVHAGISFVHVTIDGARDAHDDRRVLRGGQPTYDRVLANVIDLLERHDGVGVTLRMNLEMDSVGGASALLQAIPRALRSRVQVHATPVIRGGVERPAALHRAIAGVITEALRSGFAYYDNVIPVGRERFCSAEASSTFQVGPDGHLHRCSPSFKPEATVGELLADGRVALTQAADTWSEAPAFGPDCPECRYLPMCGGGCRLDRLRGTPPADCTESFAAMDLHILNKWLASGGLASECV